MKGSSPPGSGVEIAYRIAIAGATGAVGENLLGLLAQDRIPVSGLRLLASERSAGRKIAFRGGEIGVEVLSEDSFDGVDLAFFSAGSARSRAFAPAAVASGAVVIDNSSAFRMDPDVPLVVPEINPGALRGHSGIVANPNCTTIVTLMAVAPLFEAAGAVSLRAASYQAASGAGARAMRELESQSAAVLGGEEPVAEVFPHRIAFNLLPQVGDFLEDGSTEEEAKLRDESRKILGLPDLRVSATCVRVPVLRAHGVAVWIETDRPVSPDEAREILGKSPGVIVVDDPGSLSYPMPLSAMGAPAVEVGRIRADETFKNGLALFAVGDQLLKGAALNAVQIAKTLIRDGDGLWPR